MKRFLRRSRAIATFLNLRGHLERRRARGARALVLAFAALLLPLALAYAMSDAFALSNVIGGIGAPLLGFAAVLIPRPLMQRLDPKVGYGGEGSVAVFELPRGLLYQGVVLHGKYTDTVSADATSVKTYGLPIDRIDVVAENGVVLHSVRPTDVVREMQTEARIPLAAMLAPPSSVVAGARTGSFEVPLRFQLDDVKDGDQFMLPAWRFDQVQVLVYFTNTHTNIYTGGAGVITFQEFSLSHETVVDLPPELVQNPNKLIETTELLLRSFIEKDVAAAAQPEYQIEVPRVADIERIYIMTEDANRDPVATILNAVSLVENGQVRRLSKVPAATLRTLGSKHQNGTLPVGWHVIDFTQPSDTIHAALPATQMNSLNLELDLAAVAGKVRAIFIRKAP